MKFKVYLKDPDGFFEGVRDAVRESVHKIDGVSYDEAEQLIEEREDTVYDDIAHLVEYREYITIEFDTEAGTAVVVPV